MEEFESTTRDNGSQVITERYSKENLEWLKELVETSYRDGKPKYYDIRVNHEIVVPKNSDADKFDGYLRYFTPSSKMVEVRMYHGSSPNCNKYVFVNQEQLAGAPSVDKQIEKALREDRMQREIEELRAENLKLKKKNKKYKASAQKGKPLQQLRGLFMDAASAYKSFQTEGAIHGLPENQNDQDDSQVSVEIESESDQIFQLVKEQLGEEGTVECFHAINELGKHPDLYNKIRKELDKRNKQDSKG